MGLTFTDILLLGATTTEDLASVKFRIMRNKKLLWGAIAGAVEVIVSGVPPIRLVGAVENSLSSVKAYGGLLQGGVPSGYTAVEYVQNATDGMVKSAIHIGNEDNFKMDITATVVSGSFYLFQARDVVGQNYGNATICGISGSQNGGTIIGGSGGSTSLTSGITRPNRDGHKLNIVFDCADGDMSLYVKDIDGNVSDTQTGTYDPTALTRPETNMCIYGNEAPTISTALPKNRLTAGCKVYGAKLWKNGVLVIDYVPATRDSDSAVGFYDRATNTFVTATDGSLTAGNSLAPTPSDPVDLVCNNGKISVLDHTNWNVITNPTSQTGQGMFINSDGKLQRANDRGAGVFIPVTVGKQYTLLINKKNTALGSIIRYGQSNNGDLPNSAEQLLDWYRGAIEDTMMISFTAKRPYFVMQLAASLVEAGGIDEAVEVIESAGGDYTFLKYIKATGTQYIETGLSGPARWVGAGQGTSDDTGSKCILSALTNSANVYIASRFGSPSAGQYWTIYGAIQYTQTPTLAYAEYDIDFQSNLFTGTINGEAVSRNNSLVFTTWTIGTAFGTGTAQYPFVGYIYRQQAYQNNVLVGDFIPAIRNSDNAVGMYDTVSGTFFTNAGTGTFVAGTPLGDGEVLKLTPSNDTAGVANLLKLDNYVDTQEILTGLITHKLGIYVFDGTEDWTANTVSSGRLVFYITKTSIGSNSTVLPNGSSDIKCSHFETSTAAAQSLYGTVWAGETAINFTAGDFCADLTAWTQWLADQYAAGTPVIVVYPLATEYEEPAPIPQTMQTVAGDNVLDIVQAGMSGLEVSATYMKGVSVTISEIENANIGNDVEVVIA